MGKKKGKEKGKETGRKGEKQGRRQGDNEKRRKGKKEERRGKGKGRKPKIPIACVAVGSAFSQLSFCSGDSKASKIDCRGEKEKNS